MRTPEQIDRSDGYKDGRLDLAATRTDLEREQYERLKRKFGG